MKGIMGCMLLCVAFLPVSAREHRLKEGRDVGQNLITAGRYLKTYRLLRYMGNSAWYTGMFKGPIRTSRKVVTNGGVARGVRSETKVDLTGTGFSILGTGLSLASAHYIGSAGEQLTKVYGASFQHSFLMWRVGRDLKKYRRYIYWGEGLICGSLAMIPLASISYKFASEIYATVPVMFLSGIVCLIMAPYFVGTAGNHLKSASEFFPSRQQRMLVRKAGEDLRTFTKRTYIGWMLSLGGILLTLVKDDEMSIKTGNFLTVWGIVLSALAAPWSIGSAGKKLEEAGKLGYILSREIGQITTLRPTGFKS